jgi:hypothetical protein
MSLIVNRSRALHSLSVRCILLRNAVAPVLANISRVRKHVECIFLLIRRPLVEPKEDTSDERKDSDGSVVPHKQRVLRERDESLAKSVRERRHEVPVRSNQRSHVPGCFRKGKLKTGNRGEDLRESNKNVWHGLCPNVDGRGDIFAGVHVFTTLAGGVNEVLDDGCANHCERSEDKAKGHALDGSELDASFAERRVKEVVDDWDEDHKRDGVQVRDDVVGDAVTFHGCSLRSQIVVHLVVREP